ncbi:hypothetical protein [Mycolicibacterium septicum]|uniref:hypothetical protein n=1 Tax=Mycolicibacterium septicum TaxID=98668 RepID=UPI0023610706|nr:hypothetical protein [Mycolicibacterium septicum]
MDHDIAIRKPARVGVVVGGVLSIDSSADFVRVQGADLRAVAQRAAEARQDHPGVDVLADIEVAVADTAAAARALVAGADLDAPTDTVRYVGTPAGLAGLLADIHALGIADGAVLWPLLSGTSDLIRDRTMGVLRTMTELPGGCHESRTAESRTA